MPHEEAWYQARRHGIGASEIAAAAGISQYRTPLEIYCIKRGLQSEPTDDIDCIRLGKLLEPVVKSEFTRRTGLKLTHEVCPMLRHPLYPEIIATPDATVEDGAVLECKTTNWRTAKNLGDEETDQICPDWLAQNNAQMAVTGAQKGYVAALIDGRTLKVFTIERNDRLIDELIRRARALWKCIVDGIPPKGDAAHASTADLLKSLYPNVAAGAAVELPETIGQAWSRADELAEEIKFLSKQEETLRNQVKLAMADAETATIPGFDFQLHRKLVTVKAHSRKESSYVKITAKKVANGNGD